MYIYRQLKRDSLIFCLKLSVPLILLSAALIPGSLKALARSGFTEAFPQLFFAFLPGIGGIGRLLFALFGGYQGRIRNYISAAPDPELTARQLDQAYADAEKGGRVCIAGPWTLIQRGPSTYFYETREILWVYEQTQTVQSGLLFSNSHYFTVCEADGTCTQFLMPQWDVDQALVEFRVHAPFVFRGYSEELFQLYQSDRAEFDRLVQERACAD